MAALSLRRRGETPGRWPLLLAGALILPWWLSPGSVAAAGERVRGVTISTHGSGRDWGHDVIVPTIAEIRSIGAGWVATHPYARIGADGSVRFADFADGEPPEYLVRPIREAHAQGMKILIKPHLAYWGSPFAWRGEIEFDAEQAWQRFFADYERWIVKLARACRAADAFAVGTELDRTVHREARWRAIIDRVRAATPAPLTYAANWTDYRRVPFWDAVDAIGIQAYFPLAERAAPSRQQLRDGWARLMTGLRAYSVARGRHIVFTELGYNRSHQAPVRPWEAHSDGADAEAIQLACLATALEAIEREPRVVGAFLWKWFPGEYGRRGNFRVDAPAVRALIARHWRPLQRARVSPRSDR